MENYYDELVENIKTAIDNKEYDKALNLIKEEFKMPYIPMDVEEVLKNFLLVIPHDEKSKAINFEAEDIEKMLKGDYEHQITAINYLDSINVRNYMDIIEEYLKSNADRLLKSLLIMTLVNQEIQKEITMIDKGQEYNFIPMSIEPPHLTDGYQNAYKIISDVLENDDPSSAKMAFEVLLKECYLALPSTYEIDEAKPLAYGIIKAILLALGNDQDWEKYKNEYQIDENYILDIHI